MNGKNESESEKQSESTSTPASAPSLPVPTNSEQKRWFPVNRIIPESSEKDIRKFLDV
jgi:hypothetical protein